MLAVALILSYIETLIPISVAIPGIKLGLANLAVVLCLYFFGFKESLILAVIKALLTGLLFGNFYMIIYSLCGAVLSCIIMALMIKVKVFHIPVVSAAGGVAHNIGQLIIAYFTIKTYGIIYYVPILIISGFLTGIFIGIIVSLVLPYMKKILKRSENL